MIRVRDLRVTVGDFELGPLSFDVGQGAYAVLMGSTGVGKTTLLESLCGLRRVRSGEIWLADREVTRLKPSMRGVGFVPQEGALFETMTVREHLAFALEIRKQRRKDIEHRVDELADWLGIRHLLSRKPPGLSGGERQRVALGRALSARPGILCLDEPLSALDDATRAAMYALLEAVQERTGVTTLHITHNRGEADQLADMVLLLENRVVREIDRKLLAEPLQSSGTLQDVRKRSDAQATGTSAGD